MTTTTTESAPAPSPWRRRAILALIWLASTGFFLTWLVSLRGRSEDDEMILQRTIEGSSTPDKDALLKTLTSVRHAHSIDVFVLVLAYLTAVGAAAARPIWGAIDARRSGAAGGGGPGGGGPSS